jgi:queuine tRNA-ribosyltransferase
LFDCVTPTRYGRTGTVYGPGGVRMAIGKADYARDFRPIDEQCSCHTCRTYTRAYLSHLFRAKEMLGATLASLHNLHFLVQIVRTERERLLTL